MDNYLTTLDDNGRQMINPDYYKNVILDNINLYMQETGIKRNELDANDFLAIFRSLYNTLFKPLQNKPNNEQCNIPYTDYNLNTLFNVYIDICAMYKIHPSVFAFGVLTGITETIIRQYVTSAGLIITNFRRDMLRNELARDKTGRIVLANNDSSYGLEYEKKNTVEREQIRQGLSLNELPQITG